MFGRRTRESARGREEPSLVVVCVMRTTRPSDLALCGEGVAPGVGRKGRVNWRYFDSFVNRSEVRGRVEWDLCAYAYCGGMGRNVYAEDEQSSRNFGGNW